jgi:hypothetical protein
MSQGLVDVGVPVSFGLKVGVDVRVGVWVGVNGCDPVAVVVKIDVAVRVAVSFTRTVGVGRVLVWVMAALRPWALLSLLWFAMLSDQESG